MVKFRDKPLSLPQVKALIGLLRAGHKATRSGLSFDEFRAAEVMAATEGHRSGKVSGLKAAKNSHYKSLKAHALQLLGRTGEAFALLAEDSEEGDRASGLRQLILGLLAKRRPEWDAEHRLAAANKVSQDMHGEPIERASADHLDRVYRKLKETIKARLTVAVRPGAETEEGESVMVPEPEPEPETEGPF